MLCAPFIGNIITQMVLYYTGHTLLLNEHDQHQVILSTCGVVWALLLVFLVKRKSTDPDNGFLNRHIIFASGLSIFFLAYMVSECENWHVIREVYFTLALIGAGLVVYSYALGYMQAKEPFKKVDQIVSLVFLAISLVFPVCVIWKYLSGTKGFF